jgi:hypothetical protein
MSQPRTAYQTLIPLSQMEADDMAIYEICSDLACSPERAEELLTAPDGIPHTMREHDGVDCYIVQRPEYVAWRTSQRAAGRI